MEIKNVKISLLSVIVASALFTVTGTVDARSGHYKAHHGINPQHSYYRGAHHRILPHGYKVVWIGGHEYYHHDHVYYKQVTDGYVVVEKPSTPITNNPMYIYPAMGQSEDQQRQDRYECHVWASDQTGFDPSNINTKPTTKLVYLDQPKRGRNQYGMVTGAVGGAAVGALGGAIAGDPGIGAAVGAGLGAIIGAIKQDQEKKYVKQTQVVNTATTNKIMNQNKANYDRAITACLEARNYTVK